MGFVETIKNFFWRVWALISPPSQTTFEPKQFGCAPAGEECDDCTSRCMGEDYENYLNSLTVPQLLDIARDDEVYVTTKMRKAEIIERILAEKT